jgi:hypothetical protein
MFPIRFDSFGFKLPVAMHYTNLLSMSTSNYKVLLYIVNDVLLEHFFSRFLEVTVRTLVGVSEVSETITKLNFAHSMHSLVVHLKKMCCLLHNAAEPNFYNKAQTSHDIP